TEDGGYHFERLWRGVTDHHIVEAAFLVSAEARKLHALAVEQAPAYLLPSRLVSAKGAVSEVEAALAAEAADGEEAEAPVTAAKGETLVSRPSQLLDAI